MKLVKITILACALGSLSSCDDMLDPKKTNEWADNVVWTNPDMAQAVLTSVYSNMMVWPDSYDGNFLDAATDNALTNSYGSTVYRAGMGAFSRSSNPIGIWEQCYDQFQNINLFMERGVTDAILYNRVNPETDKAIKTRLLGEAHFLRAWYGFRLLQMYGGRTDGGEVMGYTVVDHFIGDKEAARPDKFRRDTYARCVGQVIDDCEEAFRRLPMVYTGSDVVSGESKIGRACGLAAQALKAKVLLYAASPAYQPASVVRIDGMGDYTVLDEAAFNAGWERAALYADEVLKAEGIHYDFTAMTAANLADAGKDSPDDFILRTYLGETRALESRYFPPFYMGNAQTVPSENLAESFPALNGYPVSDPRSGYKAADPYAIKRDKRFAMNIYHHGSKFGDNDSNIDVSGGGKDSEGFHNSASRSGYYLAKFLSKKKDMLDPINPLTAFHYNPLLRKTEVWLNYAEAANEAWGPKGKGGSCRYSAYDVLKLIREKSGGITNETYLEEMAASKDSFRRLIRNERRIEFAFEGQRFWDLRRCLLPLDTKVKGMEVTRTESGFSYAVKEIEERPMTAIRYYYLPLPYEEQQKNPNLENNMGWNNN